MPKPFFSIIVAAYNAEQTIAMTIDSVLTQKFEDYEIIVKDGGSKDGTLEKIPSDERIRVYSNPDGGIYPGMNEGIGYACGRYLCFLNCGDVFVDAYVLGTIYERAKELRNSRNILYGNYRRNNVKFKQPSRLSAFYLYRTPLCHQTMFFGKDFLEEFGGYDTQYRILADYNHTLLAFTSGVPFVYCDCSVCNYLGGGASETAKGVQIKKEEYKKIKTAYYTKRQRVVNDLKIFFTFKGLREKLISDKSPQWVRKLYRKLVNFVNG